MFVRRTFAILLRNIASDIEEAVRCTVLVVTPQVFLIGQLFGREDDDCIAQLMQCQGCGSDTRNAFFDDAIGQAVENLTQLGLRIKQRQTHAVYALMRIVLIDDFIPDRVPLVTKCVYGSSVVHVIPVIAYTITVTADIRIEDFIARVLYLYGIGWEFLPYRGLGFDLIVIHTWNAF